MKRISAICQAVLWVAVGLYAFFLPWGVTGAHIALGIALLAWVVKSLVERRVCWLGRPVGWPVGALVVVLAVASLAAHSAWRGETMRELASFRTLLAIFLVASNLRSEEGLRRLALFLVASLALFSLYATVGRLLMIARNEAVSWPLVVSKSQAARIEHDRLLGPLDEEGRLEPGGEPGALWLPALGSMSEAGQLAMAVPLAFALLPAVRRRKLLPVLVAALIVLGVNLLLNMKRGAWMACVAALLVLAIVERRRAALAVVCAFIVAVAVVPAARSRVVETLAGNDGHRLRLWCAVPRVVRVYPLGVGLGCSHHVVKNKAFVPRDVYLAMPNRDHFHNSIAELAVCASPLAVAAYLWWFGAFGVWALRRLRRMRHDAPGRPIVLAGLLAAVAFFVNGLVEYNLGDSDVTMMLYLAIGMAMAAVPTRSGELNIEDAHGGGPKSLIVPRSITRFAEAVLHRLSPSFHARLFWDHKARRDPLDAILRGVPDKAAFDVSGTEDVRLMRSCGLLSASDVVLDYGCGIGRVIRHVAPLVKRVVGVDISPKMIRLARRDLCHLANVELLPLRSAARAAFASNAFDVVYSFYVLQHMDKTEALRLLREFHRMARPEGSVFVQLPMLDSVVYARGYDHTLGRPAHDLGTVRTFSRSEIEEVFEAVGLRTDHVLRHGENFFVSASKPG